jgi:peptidoglycan/LPS O-acetylase OafA/YrhL
LSGQRHFSTLDGLRGVAAIAVLFRHTDLLMHPTADPFPHAYLAVDFFFMLSGLVVAKAYEARLSTSMTFSEFVKVRLVRLYPMIFLGVLLGAFVLTIRLVTTHSITADHLMIATFSALVLLPTTALFTLYPGMLYPVNAPEWSLFFELVANFVYAPVVCWLRAKPLTIICVLSSAALVVVAISYDGLNIGQRAEDFFLGFIRVVFPFFLGVLLFRYRPAYRLNWLASLFLGLLLGIVLLVPVFKDNWLYDFIAVAFIFPPIVFLGSICANRQALNIVCLWFGELSYPLYITHHPILRIIVNAFDILHLHIPSYLAFGASVVAAVLAANLFLMVWDRPVRKCLSGFRRDAAANPVG